MSEKLETYFEDIILRTGRTDLLDKGLAYEKNRDELLALIDDKSGFEKVDKTLKEEEKKLKEEYKSKRRVGTKKLEEIYYRGKAELAAEDAQELEEKQDEEHKQAGRDSLLAPKTMEELDALRKHFRKRKEELHEKIVVDTKAILGDLDKSLRKYIRAKTLVFLVPKLIYLLFTLLILTIGASKLGEQIQGDNLKLGFAVAIWAGQEFLIAPLYGGWLLRYRKESLKRFAREVTEIKKRRLFDETNIEYVLKEYLTQVKEAEDEIQETGE